MLSVIVAAFIGGAFHAVLGIRKYGLKRGQISAVVADGIVGAVAGAAALTMLNLSGDSALLAAGLSGYVGADVIESLFKIRIKRGGSLI